MHFQHLTISLLLTTLTTASPFHSQEPGIYTLQPRDSTSRNLTVTIKDTTGAPITNILPKFHDGTTSHKKRSSLSKRIPNARAITDCPASPAGQPLNAGNGQYGGAQQGWFARSWCDRTVGVLQNAYKVECTTPFSQTAGTCAPYEICYDYIYSGPNAGPLPTAYCVPSETFVRLGALVAKPDGLPDGFGSYLPAEVQPNDAVEVALVGDDPAKPILTAAKMEIDAFDSFGAELTPTNSCGDPCVSIGLQPIPARAAKVSVQATLPVGVQSGALYLAYVVPASW